jgi:hypothetical protein
VTLLQFSASTRSCFVAMSVEATEQVNAGCNVEVLRIRNPLPSYRLITTRRSILPLDSLTIPKNARAGVAW